MPLVVPEINPEAVRAAQGHHRQSQLLDHHLHHAAVADPPAQSASSGMIVSTYQAASGAGRRGDGGVARVHARVSGGPAYQNTVLPHPYAFNLFSHNTRIDPANGYNEEEMKVIQETHKIFGDSEHPHRGHLRAGAGFAGPLHRHQFRVRAADHAGAGAGDAAGRPRREAGR